MPNFWITFFFLFTFVVFILFLFLLSFSFFSFFLPLIFSSIFLSFKIIFLTCLPFFFVLCLWYRCHKLFAHKNIFFCCWNKNKATILNECLFKLVMFSQMVIPESFYFFSNVSNVIKNVYKPTKNCKKCILVFTVMNSQHCENKFWKLTIVKK